MARMDSRSFSSLSVPKKRAGQRESALEKRDALLEWDDLNFIIHSICGMLESQGYIEDDLMENDLKSFFRAFSSLDNWIMV